MSNEYNIFVDTWEDYYNNKKRGIEKLKLGRKQFPLFISYPLYLFYLFLFSLIKIKGDDFVICMDLDVFIPIWIGSLWKKTKIYFDIVDPIAETRFRKIPFNKIFDFIEYFLLKYRKNNILPADYRIKYYEDKFGIKIDKNRINYIVIENVPFLTSNNVQNWPLENDCIKIGYFGTLEPERGIIELINFAKRHHDIKLIIAGMGSLENCIKRNLGKKNIFLGSYSPERIGELYKLVDYIWAYYSQNSNLLHYKYACPNKYYEHLCFKKPIIINKGVYISNKIENMKTGIVIPDDLSEANFELIYSKLKSYKYIKDNFILWENKYFDYKNNVIDILGVPCKTTIP